MIHPAVLAIDDISPREPSVRQLDCLAIRQHIYPQDFVSSKYEVGLVIEETSKDRLRERPACVPRNLASCQNSGLLENSTHLCGDHLANYPTHIRRAVVKVGVESISRKSGAAWVHIWLEDLGEGSAES